jgi:hypothetical protein
VSFALETVVFAAFLAEEISAEDGRGAEVWDVSYDLHNLGGSKLTADGTMFGNVVFSYLSSLEMTGKSIDATVRYIVSHCLFVSFAFGKGRRTSVRSISSSFQGALNSLGRGVISSVMGVSSNSPVSTMSAVLGSILSISLPPHHR